MIRPSLHGGMPRTLPARAPCRSFTTVSAGAVSSSWRSKSPMKMISSRRGPSAEKNGTLRSASREVGGSRRAAVGMG